MTCRSCGTEIADKAIVCYRCGAPTAVPQPRPAARRGGAWLAPVWAVVAAALVIVAAGVLLVPRLPPGVPRAAAYGAVALAIVLVGWRLRSRRSR